MTTRTKIAAATLVTLAGLSALTLVSDSQLGKAKVEKTENTHTAQQDPAAKHFAKVENGVVTQVIVAKQNFINTLDGEWISTYKDKSKKGNYAGVGYTYNESVDLFIPPRPSEFHDFNTSTAQWEDTRPVIEPTPSSTPPQP